MRHGPTAQVVGGNARSALRALQPTFVVFPPLFMASSAGVQLIQMSVAPGTKSPKTAHSQGPDDASVKEVTPGLPRREEPVTVLPVHRWAGDRRGFCRRTRRRSPSCIEVLGVLCRAGELRLAKFVVVSLLAGMGALACSSSARQAPDARANDSIDAGETRGDVALDVASADVPMDRSTGDQVLRGDLGGDVSIESGADASPITTADAPVLADVADGPQAADMRPVTDAGLDVRDGPSDSASRTDSSAGEVLFYPTDALGPSDSPAIEVATLDGAIESDGGACSPASR